MLWVRSGLIDIHSKWGQSVHLNLGLKRGEGVNLLMRSLQLTGDAYQPLFENQIQAGVAIYYSQNSADHHTLRLMHKPEVPEPQYTECKEFDLTTPKAFLRFLRLSQLLGTSLKAYQDLTFDSRETDQRGSMLQEPKMLFSDWYDPYNPAAKVVKPQESRLTSYQYRLMYLWIQFSQEMTEGLAQLDLENWLQSLVPTVVSSRTVREIQAVYPTVWSRLEINPSRVETLPFVHRGQQFANPVHFAQAIANRYAKKIEAVLDQAESELG
jgi:hypothetical protein